MVRFVEIALSAKKFLTNSSVSDFIHWQLVADYQAAVDIVLSAFSSVA